MGEGLLPGGVFRKSAPGEFEINIPGIAESPVNRIIRNSYRGRRKGESQTRTPDELNLYPRGFTPIVDFISNPENKDPITGNPVEVGVKLNTLQKDSLNTAERHRHMKESYLNFFDAQTLQFKHLVEYYDTTSFRNNSPTDVRLGQNGISPESFSFGEDRFTSTYLGSFLKTHRNNEDPTILGFDFSISLPNSPLFNGSVEKFLDENSENNVELLNRRKLLDEFRYQLLSFFKTWDPNHMGENLPSVGQFFETDGSKGSPESNNLSGSLFRDSTLNKRDGSKDYLKMYKGSAAKAYYLQSITGLDKLSETNDFGGQGKRFIDYGKDFLTLTLNEDVSQNMGYLASLYKNLTWSRERGRMMIPENLLRFEAVLDITEIRNYVRIYQSKKQGELDKFREITDYTSKYRYFIHDCQFFFDKMPHSDTLNNSVQSDVIKGLDLKVYFKHANMRFMKFVAPGKIDVANDNYSDYINRYVNNNLNLDEDYFSVKYVDNTTIRTDSERVRTVFNTSDDFNDISLFDNPFLHGSVTTRNSAPISHPVSEFTLQQTKNITNLSGLSDLERRKQINAAPTFAEKLKVGIDDAYKNLKRQVVNSGANFINRKLLDAASLVNRTLNQIFNSTPVVGGIKPPKNIYNRPNEWEQAYIDFIGPGLKTFFENPLNFRKVGREGETLEEKIAQNRLLTGNQLGSLGGNTTINSDIFGNIDTFSNNPEIGNSADPGKNKKLQTIVDENPSLGLPGSRIPFNTNQNNSAAIGNNADIGSNLKLQDIVDSNPSMGIPGSLIPFNTNNQASIGNNADVGSNLKLQDIVNNNPSLGLPGSLIPFTTNEGDKASIGNNADYVGTNLSLQQIVLQNPSLGLPGSLIPSNSNLGGLASLGNNADIVTTNLTLQQIVENDPNLGNGSKLLEGFFSKNPSLGNNGILGDNSNLSNLIMDNSIITTLGAFEWDNIQFPNSAQRLPQPTTTGTNNLSDVIKSNTSIKSPELGNSSVEGPNNPLQGIINNNTEIKNPFIGNSGELGNSTPKDSIVKDNSDVINPSIGNSGEFGISQINDLTIRNNTDVDNPSLGNSGQGGNNTLLDSKVDQNSDVENSEIGNSGLEGKPNLVNKIIDQNSDVDNPFLGNSSGLGNNISTNKVVDENSKLQNEEIGNSAEVGKSLDRTTIIEDNSTLEDTSIGNSALTGQSKNLDELLKYTTNSKLSKPIDWGRLRFPDKY